MNRVMVVLFFPLLSLYSHNPFFCCKMAVNIHSFNFLEENRNNFNGDDH